MPVDTDPEAMLILHADRRAIRLHVPPVQLAGFRQPLRLHIDLDVGSVDAIILRLVRLRAQMDLTASATKTPMPRTERMLKQAKRALALAEVQLALDPNNSAHRKMAIRAQERVESLLQLLSDEPKDTA